ncbi:hypothetical protein DL98DRAFT_472364 [Cadophora sp. DSE1049]|nr:hypothetical protein DL98DRAFT_472364 [Cadophora sp. DSE1049]
MQGTQSTYGCQRSPAATSIPQPRRSSATKKESTPPPDSGYALSVSPDTALDLIDEFFNTIHCFLPLFHPAHFKEKYASLIYLKKEQNCGLPLESAFILNGIFCLSARFSTAALFSTVEPVHRGDQFVAQATSLYELLGKQVGEGRPSLAYLQGAILLTFCALQSGPTRLAWWLSGVCVRLAYELELHNTDADIIRGDVDPLQLLFEAWQNREERRRTWWIVWDMDTFASATTLKPFAVNLPGMQVLLPISDEAWLTSEKMPSTYLDHESTTLWEGLCDLPNQSTWAWILACTVLLRQVIGAVLSPTSDRLLEQLDASFGCFGLALPENFRADLDSVGSHVAHSKDANWVVCTLLLFNSAKMMLALHKRRSNGSKDLYDPISRINAFPSLLTSPTLVKNDSCDGLRKEIVQVARTWPPQILVQATPFIAMCLAGPAFAHVARHRQRNSSSLDDLNLKILIFPLKRFARYWNIARVLLGKRANRAAGVKGQSGFLTCLVPRIDELSQFQKNEKNLRPDPAVQERKACQLWSDLVHLKPKM